MFQGCFQSRPQSEVVALPLLWDLGDLIGCNSVFRSNSVLRGLNGCGMSKFDGKPHSLPTLTMICFLSPKFGEQLAISLSSCGESFLNLQLRPIFVPNKPILFSHLTHLLTPDYCRVRIADPNKDSAHSENSID